MVENERYTVYINVKKHVDKNIEFKFAKDGSHAYKEHTSI